jgi:flagellar protein FlaF
MYANQLKTYETVSKSTLSGRQVEAAVLTKAALKLKHCQENWEAEDRNAKLDEALKFNQLVWSIFQAELVRPDNPLPKKLRQDILSLSVFIDKRIFETMAYPAPEKLTAIININLNLAAGLNGSPS